MLGHTPWEYHFGSAYYISVAIELIFLLYMAYITFIFKGESQVYTMGRIGNKNVVSTKLSRTPDKSQATMISAENTITRMLGKYIHSDFSEQGPVCSELVSEQVLTFFSVID